MHLQVKYGLITLINQERDACDTIEQADLKCPLKKGELSLTKDVDLPAQIPPVRAPRWQKTELYGQVLTWWRNRAHTPCWPMCTPRTAIRSPASLRRSLSTGNCSSVSHHSSLRRRSSNSNDNSNKNDANPSRDDTIDGSGILSFNKVKVGKRKFEMTGPAAGLVQQRMQERMRQRNEL